MSVVRSGTSTVAAGNLDTNSATLPPHVSQNGLGARDRRADDRRRLRSRAGQATGAAGMFPTGGARRRGSRPSPLSDGYWPTLTGDGVRTRSTPLITSSVPSTIRVLRPGQRVLWPDRQKPRQRRSSAFAHSRRTTPGRTARGCWHTRPIRLYGARGSHVAQHREIGAAEIGQRASGCRAAAELDDLPVAPMYRGNPGIVAGAAIRGALLTGMTWSPGDVPASSLLRFGPLVDRRGVKRTHQSKERL